MSTPSTLSPGRAQPDPILPVNTADGLQGSRRTARWHLRIRDDHDLPHLRRRRKDVADDVGDLRQGLLVLGVVRRRGEELQGRAIRPDPVRPAGVAPMDGRNLRY